MVFFWYAPRLESTGKINVHTIIKALLWPRETMLSSGQLLCADCRLRESAAVRYMVRPAKMHLIPFSAATKCTLPVI